MTFTGIKVVNGICNRLTIRHGFYEMTKKPDKETIQAKGIDIAIYTEEYVYLIMNFVRFGKNNTFWQKACDLAKVIKNRKLVRVK